MYRRWPPRYDALKAARRACNKGRQRWEFNCSKCKKWFKQTEVEVDHVTPAGSLKDYDDLPRFVSKLFCPASNLQILCKPCHKRKTLAEKRMVKK